MPAPSKKHSNTNSIRSGSSIQTICHPEILIFMPMQLRPRTPKKKHSRHSAYMNPILLFFVFFFMLLANDKFPLHITAKFQLKFHKFHARRRIFLQARGIECFNPMQIGKQTSKQQQTDQSVRAQQS